MSGDDSGASMLTLSYALPVISTPTWGRVDGMVPGEALRRFEKV
jgi:hypothetical protein